MTSGASGTGNGAVAFIVLPNLGGARTGTITIAGQTFTVTQAALVCTYSINPTSVTMPDTRATSTVAVSAGAGCAWTASSNDGWITITSGASGNGDGTVTFSVNKHNGNERPDRHADDRRTHVHGQATGEDRLIRHALISTHAHSFRARCPRSHASC